MFKVDEAAIPLIAAAMESRRPSVVRHCLSVTMDADSCIIGVLAQLRTLLSKRHPAGVIVFDANGNSHLGRSASPRLRSAAEELLPAEPSMSIVAYAQSLSCRPSFAEFGVYIEAVHQYPELWPAYQQLSKQLSLVMPRDVHAFTSDAWLGSYRQTPIGAHRDPLHNIMLMVTGERTMRLWSDSAWRRYYPHARASDTFLDYKEAAADGEVHHLASGDLLFWPADYWHVGEGVDVSLSLNFDMLIRDDEDTTDPSVSRAFQSVIEEFGPCRGIDMNEAESLTRLSNWDPVASLRVALRREKLARQSASGFLEGRKSLSGGRPSSAPSYDRVTLKEACILCFEVANGFISVGVAGHSRMFAFSDGLSHCLSELRDSGEAVVASSPQLGDLAIWLSTIDVIDVA